MEEIECILFLRMWLILTSRRKTLFHERLREAKRNTAEKTGEFGNYYRVQTTRKADARG